MSIVPVIDIAAMHGTDAARKRLTAQAVDDAARDIGFLAISGHGVPDAVYTQARDAARAFFALSPEVKQACSRPSREESRGYAALGGEALSRSLDGIAPYDLKETFAIGPIDAFPPALLGDTSYPHYTPNVWPDEVPAMRAAWETYYRHMWRLSDDVLRLLALALGIDENWFASRTDHCYSNLRAQHYPPLARPPLPGQYRASAHTDYGALTVLRGDPGISGLEVETKAGEWAEITFTPDTYVVNLGDQLAMWSNDRWRSTLHRVATPVDDAARGSGRLTLGFFHMPNADAVIECLPHCAGPDNPPKYPAVPAGWHKRLKFAKANGLDDIVALAPESVRRAASLR